MGYTWARLTTDNKVHVKFGRLEARIQMPRKGRGSLPAFWMLGANFPKLGWPTCGEIDIMEWPGFEKTQVHATVHSKYKTIGKNATVSTASSEFHIYGFEWAPDELKFDVDGEVYHTFRKVDVQGLCPSGVSAVAC